MAGVRFEASNGNSIFLPAGGYWLNSFDTDDPTSAWNFSIGADLDSSIINSPRYTGLLVRPVHPYG